MEENSIYESLHHSTKIGDWKTLIVGLDKMFHTFYPSYDQASQLQVETTCPNATLGI